MTAYKTKVEVVPSRLQSVTKEQNSIFYIYG